MNWDIEKVTLSDEGSYECIAVSSAGTGRAQTFFDVSGNCHELLCSCLSLNAAVETGCLLILASPHISCVTLLGPVTSGLCLGAPNYKTRIVSVKLLEESLVHRNA